MLKFSIESLTPTNGSPSEESQKWKIICSYFENLGSSVPARFEVDVDLNINTVNIKKLSGSPNLAEGKYTVTKKEKEKEEKADSPVE